MSLSLTKSADLSRKEDKNITKSPTIPNNTQQATLQIADRKIPILTQHPCNNSRARKSIQEGQILFHLGICNLSEPEERTKDQR